MNDVFLVSALEDREKAELVARRLRALKMKVHFDKKREGRTFDSKDARNAERSKNMLVLWSKDADQSDWVHAAARTGRSRDVLIQTALDDVVPRDPFHLDNRISLDGFTARKNTDGWFDLVDELAKSQERPGLREFAGFATKDTDSKAAWLKAHPKDALAIAAAGGAAKAAASSGPYRSDWRKDTARWNAWSLNDAPGLPAGVPDDVDLVGGIAEKSAEGLKAEGIGSLASLATLDDDRIEGLEKSLSVRKDQIYRQEWVEQARELLEGKPPRAKVDRENWEKWQATATLAAASAAVAGGGAAAVAHAEPVYHQAPAQAVAGTSANDGDYIKIGIVTAILSAIALMFFLGWLFGKEERNAAANSCPAGFYPLTQSDVASIE